MARTPCLTADEAQRIRDLYAKGQGSYATLATRFGVSTTTIHSVLTSTYPHTRGLPSIAGRRGRRSRRAEGGT